MREYPNIEGYIYTYKSKVDGVKWLHYSSPYLSPTFKNGKLVKGKRRSFGKVDTKPNRLLLIKHLEKLKEDYFKFQETGIRATNINDLFEYFLNDKYRLYDTLRSYKLAFIRVYNDENFENIERVEYQGRMISKIEYGFTQIKSFINTNTGKPLSQSSKANYYRSMKTFANWLIRKKYIEEFDIKQYHFSPTKKRIEVLTESELKEVLSFAKIHYPKVYPIFLFLTFTGARIKESLEIDIENIDLENNLIYVKNKTNKNSEEFLVLSSQAMELCSNLIDEAKVRNENQNKLFNYKASSRSYITKVLSKILKNLNIKKNTKTHLFRKTFATNMINSGISQNIVSTLMRHKDERTTREHYQKTQASNVLQKSIPKIDLG